MTSYYLHTTYRGFQLYKSKATELTEILTDEPEDFGDETWKPMVAFLQTHDGQCECLDFVNSAVYQTPPTDWIEKKGHQVVVCEIVLKSEIETDEIPSLGDFEWIDGRVATYKGKQLEVVDLEEISRLKWQ